MTLQEHLAQELQQALKDRDAVRVSTLRLLISAVRNREIERRKTISDSEVLEVIAAEAKSRRESMAEYQKGGRGDLADREAAELKILQAHLPAALSDSELRDLIRGTLQAVGAKGPQDMGKVMSALMPKIRGRADGKQAQQLAQKLLQS